MSLMSLIVEEILKEGHSNEMIASEQYFPVLFSV